MGVRPPKEHNRKKMLEYLLQSIKYSNIFSVVLLKKQILPSTCGPDGLWPWPKWFVFLGWVLALPGRFLDTPGRVLASPGTRVLA